MPQETWLNDFVFTVVDLFTPEECDNYIQISEDVGYEDALLTGPQGNVLRKDVRNNQRVMFQNEEMAGILWDRARDFVPVEYDGRPAVGVNELLRFYRYDVGQRFNWHQDLPFERDNGETSFLTFLIYLNDDFTGGETAFEDSWSDTSFDEFSVRPRQGMALFFEHATHHKGEAVTEGRKYVLRTDVMYGAEETDDADYSSDDEDFSEEAW